jgi:hypothetical protein
MPKLTRRNLLQQSPTAGLLLAGSPTRTTQADDARAQERQVDRECVIAAGLTDDEADCWVLVAQAAGKALALPELHPMERQELTSAFHVIQNRLLSRPTYRKYTDSHNAARKQP